LIPIIGQLDQNEESGVVLLEATHHIFTCPISTWIVVRFVISLML